MPKGAVAPLYHFPLLRMATNISVKQALIIIPSVFIGIIVIAGIIAESGEPEVAPVVTTTQQAAVFDVPTLVGKNIDEVRTELGTPTDKDAEPTAQQMQFGTTEWYNSFDKDGRSLLVTFNPSTRQITDFFISATNDATNTQSLLAVGNLTENDPRYSVEFVKALQNPSEYTGVKVVPR